MPQFSAEFYLGTTLAVITLVVGLGATLAMDARTKGEFYFAVSCFMVSALAFTCVVGLWDVATVDSMPKRVLIAALLFACIGVGLVETIRWSYGRHLRATGTEPPHKPPVVETQTLPPQQTQPSQAAIPRQIEPPIRKNDSFATLVPILPKLANFPVPMDTNYDDPHHDFYSELMGLAARPEKQPDGWPLYQDRELDKDNGARFVIRLVHYYIFRQLYFLERGSTGGIKWKAGQGVTPIQRSPIPPPGSVGYPNERVIEMLSGSEFFRPADRMLFNFDNRQFPVPKGSRLSFVEQPSITEQGRMQLNTVRFERRGYYRLDFSVSIGMANLSNMPAGFGPASIDGVYTWTVPITMSYEIQRRDDDGFVPADYVGWAEQLFDGLKKQMAF